MKPKFNKKKSVVQKKVEPVSYDSETIRLASLKKQKQAFREKEQLIRNALNCVDGPTQNKKIIFDDDTIESYENNTNVVEKKKKQLFDDADDDDGNDSGPEVDLNICEKEKVVTLGNDDRFKMSKQYLDKNNDAETPANQQNDDADDFTNEKNKDMEILQSVLGRPIQQKTTKPFVEKKSNTPFRYDPMAPNHQEYEQEIEKPVSKKKRKAEKAKKMEEEEPAPIPVSNDVFFSVSDKLGEALKGKEEFSLLSSFGAVDSEINEVKDKQPSNFNQMNYELPSKNPFKYDSTDDEGDNFDKAEFVAQKSKKKLNKKESSTFFLAKNDTRFKDAEEFFKSEAVLKESFNHVRRELKQIVRKKIRNNAKNLQPRKKKIETMKKKKSR